MCFCRSQTGKWNGLHLILSPHMLPHLKVVHEDASILWVLISTQTLYLTVLEISRCPSFPSVQIPEQMAIGLFGEELGKSLWHTFCNVSEPFLLETNLLSPSMGSGSINWLRSRNWTKDSDFCWGGFLQPPDHLSLVSSNCIDLAVRLMAAHLSCTLGILCYINHIHRFQEVRFLLWPCCSLW